jgi:hypothetical protein
MTNRYRDESTVSPRPWRVLQVDGECDGIVDVNGDAVIETDTGVYPPNLATAEFICKCVNEHGKP